MSVAILAMAVAATIVPAWSAVADAALTNSALIAPMALNAPVVGMAATPSGKGAWRVACRRRCLHFRRRALLRVDRRHALEPADRRHRRDSHGARLLVRRFRRRRLLLR